MGLNSHERFENHMDIASPETIGDAEKKDFITDDAYDDMFEERLSYAKNYVENASAILLDERNKKQDYNDVNKHSVVNDSKEPFTLAHIGLENREEQRKNEKEFQGDIVFEGTASENPQYGEGGGNQYFVRNFGEMKQDGRMVKIEENHLVYTGSLIKTSGKTSEVEKQEYKFTYNVDTKELSDEEKEEWKQLDEQTRDEKGLSRAMLDTVSQKAEDRKNPWSDQENSNGAFFPDSYSNPRELQKGESYYQLRPIDAVYDSPYLTDKKTIDSCRGENGEVDVEQLLRKLQVTPSKVRMYTLSQYVYEPSGESNKM